METSTRTRSYLPQVLLATTAMAGIPIVLVWALLASERVTSVAGLVVIAVVVSVVVSQAGAAIWKRRPAAGDLLFGELMIWGWLRRLWNERRLASAIGTIGPAGGAGELSLEQQAERLRRLSEALEASDPYTHGHSRRVARHSATIAKRLGLPPEQVAKIRTAAAIHDVGKISTPPAVLRKNGRLTDLERRVVERHPVDGAEMAATLEDPEITRSVLHHHERLDGSGYPAGLTGDEIPVGARIIAVADTFDAIASTRPYRHAKPHRAALDVLAREAGWQLDPAAVRAFLSHYSSSRSLTVWTVLISVPERMTGALGGGVNAASAAVAGAAVAVVTALGASTIEQQADGAAHQAAGSGEAAQVAPAASSEPTSRRATRRDRGDRRQSRGKRDGGARPGAVAVPVAAPPPSAAPVTGAPATPIADTVPAGGASQPGGPAPPSPGSPAPSGPGSPPPGPAPGGPGGGGGGAEPPDGGIHLLPHLPVGPHLPHLPGFEN